MVKADRVSRLMGDHILKIHLARFTAGRPRLVSCARWGRIDLHIESHDPPGRSVDIGRGIGSHSWTVCPFGILGHPDDHILAVIAHRACAARPVINKGNRS